MKNIALVRGKYLNKYEMQNYEPLSGLYRITAFGSKQSIHDKFSFPVLKLLSPMDLPEFPYKMPILNRIFKDAQILFDLEKKLVDSDILHSAETYLHFTNQSLNVKRKYPNKKVVLTIYENIPFNNEGIWGRKDYKRRAIQETDHFIAVTKEAKQALIKEGADKNKITVIPMGIDIKKFTPLKKVNTKNVNVLFIGRLEDNKGIFDVLEIFKRSLADEDLKEYHINLRIIGKGSQENKLHNLIKKFDISDKVTIREAKYNEIHKLYNWTDIFIAPSKSTKYWKEQLGMVFIEAMASGLPTISYDSGSIKEVIGDCGLLATEGDIDGLYTMFKKIIKDQELRIKLGKRSRRRAIKLYDSEKVAKKINDIYIKVLNE